MQHIKKAETYGLVSLSFSFGCERASSSSLSPSHSCRLIVGRLAYALVCVCVTRKIVRIRIRVYIYFISQPLGNPTKCSNGSNDATGNKALAVLINHLCVAVAVPVATLHLSLSLAPSRSVRPFGRWMFLRAFDARMCTLHTHVRLGSAGLSKRQCLCVCVRTEEKNGRETTRKVKLVFVVDISVCGFRCCGCERRENPRVINDCRLYKGVRIGHKANTVQLQSHDKDAKR